MGLVELCIKVSPLIQLTGGHMTQMKPLGEREPMAAIRSHQGGIWAVGARPVCFSHLNWCLSLASKEPRPGAEGEREEKSLLFRSRLFVQEAEW